MAGVRTKTQIIAMKFAMLVIGLEENTVSIRGAPDKLSGRIIRPDS